MTCIEKDEYDEMQIKRSIELMVLNPFVYNKMKSYICIFVLVCNTWHKIGQ